MNWYRLRQDSSSSQKSEIDESNSDIDIKPLYTEKQEENLPMFKHEEKPPDSDMSSEDDNDFINDDESIDESSDSKSEKDSVIVSEDSNSYMNPYMERNNEFEREDIMKILSKSTEKDRNNQKRWVHSPVIMHIRVEPLWKESYNELNKMTLITILGIKKR